MMRIVHISDLHFGLHVDAIIEPFLEHLKRIRPDLIIISGDLTHRARTKQYFLFQNFLQQLPTPVLMVPGNHDIPLYNFIARFLSPFKKYKKYVSKELFSHFENEEINILGVNSATPYRIKNGEFSHEVIHRIQTHFSTKHQRLNILFFHHNLYQFSGMHHPLNNAEHFIQYLQQSPIHLVCTGHLHYANVKNITQENKINCVILHAGSLLSPRRKDNHNSFYVIQTDQLHCRIELQVYHENAFLTESAYSYLFE
ncbi:metallophosphoesterase family protein [Legionella micdadei]|uniref:3',5'-cyclic AMP phosphodiesterase CpdA n=1 Tax=Legionella micdadei TaxID=451 RepID=A0A098GHP7_LEGMI|nr:metallophosphoesterase [Legionella micdadei]KTD26804.1 3',5'-cyclic-nucleotide phosphodiesterase [Legionella micdadei]CEG61497.1 3',5'-cyclic nucleotide phosphodiesterase [Legionella micdadei]SCY44341.1 3',5'-cyclic AMP phosphodiesterase CpdA [Legionella micdadei]